MKKPFSSHLNIPDSVVRQFNMEQFILPEGKSKGEYSVSAAQGLKVIVSKVSKTFMFRGVFNGKKISTTLGKYPEMSPDQAINMVLAFQNKLKMGINPIDEIKKIENIPTLAHFFYKDYLPLAKLNKKT